MKTCPKNAHFSAWRAAASARPILVERTAALPTTTFQPGKAASGRDVRAVVALPDLAAGHAEVNVLRRAGVVLPPAQRGARTVALGDPLFGLLDHLVRRLDRFDVEPPATVRHIKIGV